MDPFFVHKRANESLDIVMRASSRGIVDQPRPLDTLEEHGPPQSALPRRCREERARIRENLRMFAIDSCFHKIEHDVVIYGPQTP